jgi:transposase InsO family protein
VEKGHIFGNKSLLQNLQPLSSPRLFQLAGTIYTIEVTHEGTIDIATGNGKKRTITGVGFCAQTTDLMLSTRQLELQGWDVDFKNATLIKGDATFIIDQSYAGGRPSLSFHHASPSQLVQDRLCAPPSVLTPALAAQQPPVTLYDLHLQLGHVGRPTLLALIRSGKITVMTVEAADADPYKQADCTYCLQFKTATLPHHRPGPRGSADGEYVHVDIKGYTQPSRNGNKYWLCFVTDYIKYRHAVPLPFRTTDLVLPQMQAFIRTFERQTGMHIKVIRSDNGGEFISTEAIAWYRAQGLIHQRSPPDSQRHNGVAERFNRTLLEAISTNLAAANLDGKWWDYALEYCLYILNATTIGPNDKSAYEHYWGRPALLDTMIPFGEKVYAMLRPVLIDKRLGTFEQPRATMVRILHRHGSQTGWVVLYEDRVVHVADIYRATSQGQGERIQDFWDPPPGLQAEHDLEEQQRDTGQLTVPSHIVPALPESSLIASSTPLSLVSLPFPVSPSLLNPLDDIDDAQSNIYMGLLASAAAEREFLDTLPEPTSVAQAMASPENQHWLQAMLAELANLEGKGTWEEAVLPPGRKPVTAKWVFKRKLDQFGKVAKYKARLVARGFAQVPGVDFEETYSPVSRLSSLRLLLAHVATYNLSIKQADVEGAYLNGTLDVELFLHPPDGVVLTDTHCNVLRLKKSLYGLKQSGRTWWLELSSALELLHFKRVEDEWGLHVRLNADGSRSFVLIYVDDLLIAGNSDSDVDTIIASLASHWKLTTIGYPQLILGIRVHRDDHGIIALSQAAYIDTIAHRYQVTNLRAGKHAPLPSSGELSLDPASPTLDTASSRRYLELVGILLWLANATRPNLAYTASFLGRYSHASTQETLALAERALGFIYHTRHLALHLGSTGNPSSMHIYVDSDFAGCSTTRASTTGYISFVYDSPITWTARRQAVVAPSTTAAEYIAAAEAVHEAMWLRRILKQLGFVTSTPQPTVLYIDNQAAINIGLKPIHFARTKHLDVKYHIVREQVSKGVVTLVYVLTAEQFADGLTKPLAGPSHANMQRKWRLTAPPGI